jgi:hypothetical protein
MPHSPAFIAHLRTISFIVLTTEAGFAFPVVFLDTVLGVVALFPTPKTHFIFI